MEQGVYRLYRYEMDDPTGSHLRLVARFILHENEIIVLEDHTHLLGDLVSSPVDESTIRALYELQTSGYYLLENEDDINAGEYLSQVEVATDEEPVPDATFTVEIPGAPKPLGVEVYGESVVLDGAPLAPKEAEALMAQIEAGEVIVHDGGTDGNMERPDEGALV